jgi:hypothetical protein
MRKECANVKKSLRKYNRGHLFKPEQLRIERHLKGCVLCSSEYQTLQRILETKQYIRDITPPEGVVQRVRQRVSRFSALTRLLYRPLWLLGAGGFAAALYLYAIAPIFHDPDLEKLEAPPPAAAPVTAPTPVAEATRQIPAGPAAVPEAPKPDPVVITITADDEAAAAERINEAVHEHAPPGTGRFSDTVKEVSGSMTAPQLRSLFNRIQDVGKITYKRSRLAKAGGSQALPFVLRLKSAPPVAPKPEAAGGKPVEKPVDAPVDNPAGNSLPKPVSQPDAAR